MKNKLVIQRLPTKEEFKKLFMLPYEYDYDKQKVIFTALNGNKLEFLAVKFLDYLTSSILESTQGYVVNMENRTIVPVFSPTGFARLVTDYPCDGFIDMGMGIYWAKQNAANNDFITYKKAIKFTQIINEKENKQEFAE